jgi:uncharacterized protein
MQKQVIKNLFPVQMAGMLLSIALAILLSSCASVVTRQARGKDLDAAIAQRDIPAALSIVQNPKLYKAKDRVLYYLDAGLLYHYNGDWAKSNELLQQAEDAIEELTTKSISKAAASMLLNDNALDYAGEDYEDVYINVFKALNYLQLGDRDAAFVEVRRIDDKLSYLEQKHAKMAKELSDNSKAKAEIKSGKNKFHASALARYLSLIMYAAEGNTDSARIDYDNIRFAFESQSDIYPFSMPDLLHPETKSETPVLRVLTMINRGPYKRSREMHIHTSKNLLLIGSVDKEVDIFPVSWPDIREGYYFKFALPYLVSRPPRIGQVVAIAPDGSRHTLQKLEDMGRVAEQTYKIKEPVILLKSITRSVLKGIAAEEAKGQAKRNTSSLAATFLSIAADAAVFISENADLRMSQFFPAQAVIAEIPLPVGEHRIRLEYFSPAGTLLYSEYRSVQVRQRGVNLLQTWHL